MKQRRTKITVETERLLVISRGRKATDSWCDGCGRRVEMLKPAEAAAVAVVTPRTIYRWIEAGQLHFTEAPEGVLLICLNSLLRIRPA